MPRCLPVALVIALASTAALVALFAFPAQAHRSGCHRWHSCPSDRGTYTCGDLGYTSGCPKKPAPEKAAPAKPKTKTPATVTGLAAVKDGDSIVVQGREIRLHGIDAPELGQACRLAGRKWMAGLEATTWLGSRLAGRPVSCAHETYDRYKRSVATCHVAGVNLNEAIVRAGWAMAYRRYSRLYVEAEVAAKAASVGIWRGACDPPWEWRAARRGR